MTLKHDNLNNLAAKDHSVIADLIDAYHSIQMLTLSSEAMAEEFRALGMESEALQLEDFTAKAIKVTAILGYEKCHASLPIQTELDKVQRPRIPTPDLSIE